MKRLVFAVLVQFFAVLTVVAQPAFTANDVPNIGDSDTIFNINYGTDASTLSSETGNNYSWDFSDISFYYPFNDVLEYRTPEHPVSVPYVDATIELIENGSSGVEKVSLFDFQNDTLFIHRSGVAGGSGTAHVPPIASVGFPISFDDSSYIEMTLYTSGIPTGERQTTFHYDGFGTLTMPGNRTFTDVFRVHKVVSDTNFVVNTVTTYEEYIWYKQGGQLPLLRIGKTGTGNYKAFGSAATNTSTTGFEETTSRKALSIFPNPAIDIIQIEQLPEGVRTLVVYDLKGKLIQTLPLNRSMVDVSELNTGIYLLQLETDDSLYTTKLIKE